MVTEVDNAVSQSKLKDGEYVNTERGKRHARHAR